MRELQNCVERAVILCDGPEIRPEHLRLEPDSRERPRIADAVDLSGTLAEVRERAAGLAEREAIAEAVSQADGDRTAAAARLGISLSTLGRRLREASSGSEEGALEPEPGPVS